MPDAVVLGAPSDPGAAALADSVRVGDVDAALQLAQQAGAAAPLPGGGSTLRRWEMLASVSAVDLTAGRVLEPHLDALAILAEATAEGEGEDLRKSERTWGVFAANAPDARLTASPGDRGDWLLDGRKPWCSLAGRLSHALVTAEVDGGSQLFAVSLGDPGVRVVDGVWHARGLTEVTSGPVDFVQVPAHPVGGPGWYLRRPGFSYGGMGVAACWYGAAVGVARALRRAARRRAPDQLAVWHLGECDVLVRTARLWLAEAAAEVDRGRAVGPSGEAMALRVRAVVASAAERIMERVGHATGPAPLALDADHARRVADLTLYLRQHHAERDLARLGGLIVADENDQW